MISELFLLVAACLVLSRTARADAFLQSLHSFGVFPPTGSLIQATDGYLYGTIPTGGAYGFSAVFRLSTNGAFNLVYSLTNAADGNWPAGLVQAGDGDLYGTTPLGGLSGNGSIFRITTSGQFSTVYSFTGGDDGAIPSDRLVQGNDGALYGTTESTVFRITTNGTLRTLYTFLGGNDGSNPNILVFARDGNLYGTTGFGGIGSGGTVFRIAPDGSLTTLYSFTQNGPHGAHPVDCLVEGSDGAIYGATSDNCGTIFRITTNGTFKTVYDFCSGNAGEWPIALMQAHDGNFYGITQYGGANGNGAFFTITSGGALRTLYSFPTGSNGYYCALGDGGAHYPGLVQAKDGNFYVTVAKAVLNSLGAVIRITSGGQTTTVHSFAPSGDDGAWPYANLVQARDGTFYGTTSGVWFGGPYGTVFRITSDGTLTELYSFNGGGAGGVPTGLVEGGDGSLYGTTTQTGYTSNGVIYATSYGTVFRITPNGLLTTLHSFTGANDGSNPGGALLQASDGYLYGTTTRGGAYTNQNLDGLGTLFRITTNGILTTIRSFTGGDDGAGPIGSLFEASDGSIYGITRGDSIVATNCTVFRIATNGTLTTLYSFAGLNDVSLLPPAWLMQASDGSLYGTTSRGGVNDNGTVFRITTNGAVATIYSFTGGQDSSNPSGRLVQVGDGNL
jgi:uncharacterized repeat protein (TIGR03803 family)